MLLATILILVVVFASAAGTAYLYERILKLSPTNFVGTTPLEHLAQDKENWPDEPVFSEEEFKRMFLNEDEEDVRAMVKSGRITEEQVPDVLDALGISNELHFS